ncbi:alpha/beta hydrolase [Actinoplanes sp. TBRC 11911]|uniref:alpha/beta fold hydrolase n=1 Tax=Actinoplanes sp. TBRC 11911 TaxID=2729386 RepID=UPI00145F9618|nr:alpha/beta hydrolase [Actinoplanes sp. TBRC 11911]NMO51458.1 alpha/beta hydrolase [Actinoplanes sp. TBRC 11911]
MASPNPAQRAQLPDGRVLEYLTAGAADGLPLVLHHRTPLTAVNHPAFAEAAIKHGFRLIMPIRPGYGASTATPGRTVASFADDVAYLLDGPFVTIGHSGGGPYALALAAALPDLCHGVATIAGVAPFDAEGLDWFGGFVGAGLAEYRAAAQGEATLTPMLQTAAEFMRTADPAALTASLAARLSEPDRLALAGDFADWIAAGTHQTVTAQVAGWRDDDLAFVQGWGFELKAVHAPATIWHGEQDQLLAPSHGRWLADHVPSAHAEFLPGEGHISILRHFDEICARLSSIGG